MLERKEIDVNVKDNRNRTALRYAASNSSVKIVRALLKQDGIDVNAKDDRGRSALSAAAFNWGTSASEVVELLLTGEDIDIESRDNKGKTALDWAVAKGNKGVAHMLKAWSVKDGSQ